MKICQVCHRFPPHIGGVEKHVYEISKRLAEEHEVEVVTTAPSGELESEEEVEGVTVRRFNAFAPSNAYYFSPEMYRYLKSCNFNVVHAHNYHAFPALFAALAKKDEKFVFTPHYHGKGSTGFRNLLNKPYKLFGSKIFGKADKVVCVSDFERRLVERDFDVGDKVTVIPNGISLREIREAEPYDFDSKLILYVGRLERYKNIQLVIKAMRLLPDYYFYIIGNGGYKAELERLIGDLNLNNVRILTGVSDEEKYRWLKTCSMFVNLSGVEAFGMTVLEALAAGRPAIINEEGGLEELSGFDGVISISLSGFGENDLISKLAKVIDNWIGKTVRTDLSEYDWNVTTRKIEEIYTR